MIPNIILSFLGLDRNITSNLILICEKTQVWLMILITTYYAGLFSETEVENALFQMEKIKPLDLIKCQLNFTRAIGKLLTMISCVFIMIFMMKK
jgi:hypothetical protein